MTHPTAGNIGGGGFMVIRFPDGRATAIDFREKAPLAAHPEMFLDEAGEYSFERHHNSHLSVGVPGTVAGFALAHDKYGSDAWSDLVVPAVRLAADGFVLKPAVAASFEGALRRLSRYAASEAAFSKDGEGLARGEWTLFAVRAVLFTLFAVCVGEGPGWRGWLPPALQRRFSLLVTDLRAWHHPERVGRQTVRPVCQIWRVRCYS